MLPTDGATSAACSRAPTAPFTSSACSRCVASGPRFRYYSGNPCQRSCAQSSLPFWLAQQFSSVLRSSRSGAMNCDDWMMRDRVARHSVVPPTARAPPGCMAAGRAVTATCTLSGPRWPWNQRTTPSLRPVWPSGEQSEVPARPRSPSSTRMLVHVALCTCTDCHTATAFRRGRQERLRGGHSSQLLEDRGKRPPSSVCVPHRHTHRHRHTDTHTHTHTDTHTDTHTQTHTQTHTHRDTQTHTHTHTLCTL